MQVDMHGPFWRESQFAHNFVLFVTFAATASWSFPAGKAFSSEAHRAMMTYTCLPQ